VRRRYVFPALVTVLSLFVAASESCLCSGHPAAAAHVPGMTIVAPSPSDSDGWRCIDTSGPPRGSLDCAYDSERDRLIVYGGDQAGQICSDTWEWDGAGWENTANMSPWRRANHAVVYDADRRETLLFGGWTPPDAYLGDTWVWDGTSWTDKMVSGPSARANCAVAYDSNRRRVVLFGGACYQTIYGETWEWDGSQWELRSTSGPCPRMFPRMAYDGSRQKCVLFGGQTSYTGTTMQDTWEWDGSAWTQVGTGGPAPRVWHMMAYDGLRDRVVLFGGQDAFYASQYFGDTWEWNGTQWTEISAVGSGPRARGGMVFHAGLGKVVLFGGQDEADFYGDLWAYPEDLSGTDTPDGPRLARLEQNSPNPFGSATTICYDLSKIAAVRLCVYGVDGRLMRVLVDSPSQAPGQHVTQWDGRNEAGENAAPGLYSCVMETEGYRATRKMMLLR
jgi:hypothetical protein